MADNEKPQKPQDSYLEERSLGGIGGLRPINESDTSQNSNQNQSSTSTKK